MTAKELDVFCTSGMRMTAADPVEGLVPRILYPFLQPGAMRCLYPLVADGSGIRTLAGVMDALLDSSASDGDALEKERRVLYRLERDLANVAMPGGTVSEALDRLGRNGADDLAAAQRNRVAAAAGDGRLLPATPDGLRAALVHTVQVDMPPDLEWLSTRLHDILDVDRDDHSEATLSHSVGGAYADTIDFGSLSHLLDETPLTTAMEPERRARIEAVLQTLDEGVDAVYGSAHDVFETPDAVDAESERRLAAFVRLLRARRMAQLEVENRYHADVHDAAFETFDIHAIAESDMAWFPPVLGHLHEPSAMPDSLRSPGRVRLLVTFDILFTDDGVAAPGTDLARSLVGTGHFRVQQLTLSLTNSLLDALQASATTGRSSVTVVYTGTCAGDAYLSSAVACDTRLVPAFRYDPDAGSDWADRFDLSDNEQVDAPWAALDGRLATPADVLSLDDRFRRVFLVVPSDVPTDTRTAVGATPDGVLIELADASGTPLRAAVSPLVRRAVRTTSATWRLLQEWAGIDSSLVRRAQHTLEETLQAEHRAALEALEAEHQRRLAERTETLAEQIVGNIAAGLLGVQAAAPVAAAPPRTPKAAAPSTPTTSEAAPESVEEPDPADDDEEVIVLDDAYIDTPLCTSCNECINLNGLLFGYNGDKQAFIKDASAGPYKDLVLAAEKCPVRIIHPGKPVHPDEPGLAEWVERAAPFR